MHRATDRARGVERQDLADDEPVEEPEWESGVYVRVDVGTLVDMVVLSPFATRAFRELVPAVLRRYGYGQELTVSESSVGGVPIWI